VSLSSAGDALPVSDVTFINLLLQQPLDPESGIFDTVSAMTMAATAEIRYHTSGIVPLTRPQLVGTLTGLLLAALLAAIDQTIVGTAEPRIIAQLSGFDRYPWVATAYLLTSTISVPIFASLSDIYGRKPFFMLGATSEALRAAVAGSEPGRTAN
jgi:hypothetical protein